MLPGRVDRERRRNAEQSAASGSQRHRVQLLSVLGPAAPGGIATAVGVVLDGDGNATPRRITLSTHDAAKSFPAGARGHAYWQPATQHWELVGCATPGVGAPSVLIPIGASLIADDPQAAAELMWAELPCIHRGAVVGEVPCGVCGARDRLIPVRECVQHGLCTAQTIGTSRRQEIDGVRPERCGPWCADDGAV